MAAGRGPKKRIIRWIVPLVVAVLAALTARLFVWPPLGHLEMADAILVLGGSDRREPVGLRLAREGYAPLLLVSSGVKRQRLCGSTYHGVRVVCFTPDPFSTRGEARYLKQVADRDHLHSVIVVSGRAQTVRARLRVTRCFDGRVTMAPAWPGGFWKGVYQVAYEWGALAKALLWQRSC